MIKCAAIAAWLRKHGNDKDALARQTGYADWNTLSGSAIDPELTPCPRRGWNWIYRKSCITKKGRCQDAVETEE